MNASEMRNIEAWLDRMVKSPEMTDAYRAVARRAKKQQADALAGALRSLGRGIVDFVRTVRLTAKSCTAARLRHDHG